MKTAHPASASIPELSKEQTQRQRPLVSVVIPTYKPSEQFEIALKSVLRELEDATDGELIVVDDSPVDEHVERRLRELDPHGRALYSHNPRQLGISGNMNRGIFLARGHWIHILHQDDYVEPGFYRELGRAFTLPLSIGMVFCRTKIVDHDNRWLKTSSRLAWRSGVLRNWLTTIATRQRLQMPGVIVKRSVYEQIGGYRSDLRQALDWEMWSRIAAHYMVWYTPAPLATFRRHTQSETTRMDASGLYWKDILRAMFFIAQYLPEASRDKTMRQAIEWHRRSALRSARRLLSSGQQPAACQAIEAASLMAKLGSHPAGIRALADIPGYGIASEGSVARAA